MSAAERELPRFPSHHVPIERPGGPRLAGALELAAPLALGQRGLVVSPPRCGATTVLRWLGAAMIHAVPDCDARALLVDRPVEERLEWREELPAASIHGTSSIDDPDAHAAVAAIFEDAAAAASGGRHVVLLVDSFAALARALAATDRRDDERVLDGGLPQQALRRLRSCFGQARPGGGDAGSVTIIGTVQTETHQQLDDVVLHELVGTGNVEWRLDAGAMQAGLFPPVDILGSGARRTELILGEEEADRRALLRAEVDRHGATAGLGLLLEGIDASGSLSALLDSRYPRG